jgi:hypothetical protein
MEPPQGESRSDWGASAAQAPPVARRASIGSRLLRTAARVWGGARHRAGDDVRDGRQFRAQTRAMLSALSPHCSCDRSCVGAHEAQLPAEVGPVTVEEEAGR